MSLSSVQGLPPLAIINKGDVKFEDVVDNEKLIATLKSETEQPPLFAINRNLFVAVKIINCKYSVSLILKESINYIVGVNK